MSHTDNTPKTKASDHFLSVGSSVATGLVGGGVAGSAFGLVPCVLGSLSGGIFGWYAQKKISDQKVSAPRERKEVY